jgi:hypothetical protein
VDTVALLHGLRVKGSPPLDIAGTQYKFDKLSYGHIGFFDYLGHIYKPFEFDH